MSDSFRDIKKVSGRMGFKAKSAGPWEGRPEAKDGNCKSCGEYDVQLDNSGHCRDDNCRRDRLIKALYDGEAMKTKEGTIIWTPGHRIRL